MIHFSKKTLFLFVFSIHSLFAVFKQELITEYSQFLQPGLQVNQKEVTQGVQLLELMQHELQLTSDPVRAQNLADTIIAIMTTGEGVGFRPSTDAHAYMNEEERKIAIAALEKAAGYLHKNKVDLNATLQPNIIKQKEKGTTEVHLQEHFRLVDSLLFSAWQRYAQKDIEAIKGLWKPLDLFAKETPGPKWIEPIETTWDFVKTAHFFNQDFTPAEYFFLLNAKFIKPEAEPLYELQPTDNVTRLTEILKNTHFPDKAKACVDNIKKILNGPLNKADLPNIISAIIAFEKWNAYDVTQTYEKADPTFEIYDEKDATSSPQDRALLIVIAAAVREVLANPNLSIEELLKLVRFRSNDGLGISDGTRKVVQALAHNEGEIKKYVNDGLIETIKATNLTITQWQKIQIAERMLAKNPILISVPDFDFVKDPFSSHLEVIRHFGSPGDELQCGFFSLRIPSNIRKPRPVFLNMIAQNLHEKEVLPIALSILYPDWDKLKEYSDIIHTVKNEENIESERKRITKPVYETFIDHLLELLGENPGLGTISLLFDIDVPGHTCMDSCSTISNPIKKDRLDRNIEDKEKEVAKFTSVQGKEKELEIATKNLEIAREKAKKVYAKLLAVPEALSKASSIGAKKEILFDLVQTDGLGWPEGMSERVQKSLGFQWTHASHRYMHSLLPEDRKEGIINELAELLKPELMLALIASNLNPLQSLDDIVSSAGDVDKVSNPYKELTFDADKDWQWENTRYGLNHLYTIITQTSLYPWAKEGTMPFNAPPLYKSSEKNNWLVRFTSPAQLVDSLEKAKAMHTRPIHLYNASGGHYEKYINPEKDWVGAATVIRAQKDGR